MTAFGGIDWDAIQAVLQHWVVSGSGLPAGSVYWGQQDSPRIAEPAIEMRIYTETQLGQAWLDREAQPLVISTLIVSDVDPALNTLTVVAHGLVTGDGPVQLIADGSLPVSLAHPLGDTAGLPGNVEANTDYWVVVVDADTIQLSASYFDTGGNFIGNPITTLDITGGDIGTVTLVGGPRTRRAGQELLYIARAMERCTLSLECHTSAAVGMSMAMAILHNVIARVRLPSQQALLSAVNLGVQDVERVRALHGMRNAVMFEPRASTLVHFSIPSEASESGTVIQRAKGTLLTGKPFVIA